MKHSVEIGLKKTKPQSIQRTSQKFKQNFVYSYQIIVCEFHSTTKKIKCYGIPKVDSESIFHTENRALAKMSQNVGFNLTGNF